MRLHPMPAFVPSPQVVFALFLGTLTAGTQAQIAPGTPMPATVHVGVDATGSLGTVPPRMFGTFLEPIDNSINNGVMAEILVNGSLEPGLWNHAMLEQMYREQPELIASSDGTGLPLPWLPLNTAAGNRYELLAGQAANSWESVEVMGLPDELTGIRQQVYLPVPRALRYKVSLYARHVSGPTTLTVSFRAHATADAPAPAGPRRAGADHESDSIPAAGMVLASGTIAATAPGWTRYMTTLELTPDQVKRLEPVDFAISVDGVERVDLDAISVIPADAIDGLFDPEVVRMSDAMHMTELRMGGNFSSYYHWRDGIGPRNKRITMRNIAWGIPEYNQFGTNEFLAFCRLVHAEPQVDVNMGSGTPEEAADWVRYIRARYKGPLIVEVGNELYGRWQVGFPTVNQVAARTLAFSRAVHQVSPDATLLATGAPPPNFSTWNAALLTDPPGTFDLLTTHYITGTNHVEMKPATPEFMAAAAYAVPFAVGARLDAMAAQVNATPGYTGKADFAITEWLFNNKGPGERNFVNVSPSSRNEGGAVMIAAAFNTFLRHTREVRLVDMTGLMEFAGIWKRKEQVFASPPYYVFGMYSGAKDATVLPVTSDTGTYSVRNGTSGYPDVEDVPYIDVAATRSQDGRRLTLYCVNRSLITDEPVQVDLNGFAAQSEARVEQIASSSRLLINDEVDPHRVLPKTLSLTIDRGAPLAITLPHESVTVIELERQ